VLDAFVAGTAIAAACGLVGAFLVLRAQVFAGDALSHVAFTGGLAAAAGGVDVRFGVFAASVVVAVGMGVLGTRRTDDAAIGTMFAWVLGLGALFLALFTTHRSGTGNGAAAVRVLFGSILGLTRGDVWLALAVSTAAVASVLALARPLLLASLDPQLARALGVPVRAVETAFLATVGAVAAEATQAVGALLLLGLVAAPAAAAFRAARNPYAALCWSSAFAVGAIWLGLGLAWAEPQLPPSTAIVCVAAATLAVARVIPSR
jgi:zinc/manganese transport system permease protein